MAIKAKDSWCALERFRQAVLDRARRCSELTLPYLLPPEGYSETDILNTPDQSLGAMGVNSLASKLLLSLFPPNTPFFKMKVSEQEALRLHKVASEMNGKEGKTLLSAIDEALARYERTCTSEIEKDAIRVSMFYVLKLLVATGNACIHVKDDKLKVFALDKYCCDRDPTGNLTELVIQERVSVDTLDFDVSPDLITSDKCTPLYTYAKLQDNMWIVRQELKDGTVIEGTESTYTRDKLPFLVLRWTSISGDNYGRGLVDEYLGDLNSLEALTRNVLDYSAIASKVNFLIHPNGTTRPEDIARAENGEFITGSLNDIDVLMVQKHNDLAVPFQKISTLEQSLALAFLLNISVRRDAERVTATEVRYIASDLEDNLGGVYSLLSETLQKPLLKLLINKYTRDGKLPALPEGDIEPALVTGIEALGQGNDYTKLKQFIVDLVQLQLVDRVNTDDLVSRLGTSLGIEMEGLIKSQEQLEMEAQQVQQMQQQQQRGELVKALAPQLIGGLQDATEQATPS